MLPLNLEASNFVQSWNLEQSLSYDHQGHLPSLGGSPTNPRMVTNQPKDGNTNKEVYYRHGILHLHFTRKTNTRWQLPWMVTHHSSDGHPPTQGRSPTTPRMVTHQKEVYYILGIWHLHFTHKTNTRWQLSWMVTYHPSEGHTLTQEWSLGRGDFNFFSRIILAFWVFLWVTRSRKMVTFLSHFE